MLKSTSKSSFKHLVKQGIQKYAFNTLQQECQSQSKTKDIVYSEFKTQPYLSQIYPTHAKIVVKCRSQCLKIKHHRPFQFRNTLCRWCYLEEETLEHIVNCGREEGEKINFGDINTLDCVDQRLEAELISLATRVSRFLELVDY